MTFSWFSRDGDGLRPEELAQSLWGTGQIHGVALSAAMAREAERAVAATGRDDLRAARWNVDLFRAAPMQTCRVRSHVVREGRRLCLVDVVLEQGSERYARASALFLKPSPPAPGEVWEPEEILSPPPQELAPPSDEPRVPLFWSEGVGWDESFAAHQNGDRKATWQTAVPVLPDERPSPFVAVASIADATSMVTNWGSGGVEQINTDITLVLARLPVSLEIGLAASDRVSDGGIAAGTARVFDRSGRLGSSMVSSVANAERAVDFEKHDFGEQSRGNPQKY